jgi:hypothetical protein
MLGPKMPVPPLLDSDLVARRVRVRARDTVFVRGVLEASEGVGVLFAEHGGDLVLAAPLALQAALDEVIADLVVELGAVVEPHEPSVASEPSEKSKADPESLG